MLRHRQGVRLSRHEALPRSPHDREARRHHRDAWVLQCGNSWHNPPIVAPKHTPHGIPSRVAAVVRHEKCGPQREQPQSSHESQQGTELRGKHHCQYQGEVPTHAHPSNVTTAQSRLTHTLMVRSRNVRNHRVHGCMERYATAATDVYRRCQSCYNQAVAVQSPPRLMQHASHASQPTTTRQHTCDLWRRTARLAQAGRGRSLE